MRRTLSVVDPRLLLGVALLLTCGCGLSEYEQRMDQDRKRWQQFDDANKRLGPPLEMPTTKVWKLNSETKKKEKVEEDAFPERFFLRAPKGFAATIKETENAVHSGQASLFCYAGDEKTNLLMAMSKDEPVEDEKQKVNESQLVAAFQEDVCAALSLYGRKLSGRALQYGELKPAAVSLAPFSISRDKQPDLTFQHLTFEEENIRRRYLVYFHRVEDIHTAIIFDLPLAKANDPSFKQTVEYSLKSFGVGTDAARNRLAYDQWKRAQ